MLERITIEGFKSLESVSLELDAINLLVGQNGSGKSNFLDALTLLYQIGQVNCQSYVNHIMKGADGLYNWFTPDQRLIELHCQFRKNVYQLKLAPLDPHALMIMEESAGFYNDEEQLVNAYTSKLILETRLKEEQAFSVSNYILRYLDSLQVYHFSDALSPQKTASKSDKDDNRCLRPDGSNLASILYKIRQHHPDHLTRMTELFQLIEPEFAGFDLALDENYSRLIECKWYHQITDQSYRLSQLGIGSRRFLCLMVLLTQPDPPPVILLEEPDIGLSPQALEMLGGMIKTASERAQIIATTVSPTFLNQFTPEHLIHVNYQKGHSQFARLSRDAFKGFNSHLLTGQLWERQGLALGATP